MLIILKNAATQFLLITPFLLNLQNVVAYRHACRTGICVHASESR